MSTILVVDDEENITTILQSSLESEGYQTAVTRDGAEAVRIFTGISPDLVILDLELPLINGEEVCRFIRKSSTVPVLIISVKNDKWVKMACLDSGADNYLAKPFDLDELLARVRDLLRRYQKGNIIQQNFISGNLEINYNTRQMIVAGKEVKLTKKEYELVRLLITNAFKILTYDDLLSAVWGPEFKGEHGYIHNFMTRLRSKVESDQTSSRGR